MNAKALAAAILLASLPATFCFMGLPARALAFQIAFKDADGKPAAETVIGLVPAAPVQKAPQPAKISQRDIAFIPHVLAIQTGADVAFENADTTRHHVYSFSPAKRFEKQIATGAAPEHVVFDQPGIVAIGCNIHDSMLAFLIVLDTPYFAVADSKGVADLKQVPDGAYTAKIWNERSRNPNAMTETQVKVAGGAIEGLNPILDLKAERRASPERKVY